MKGIWLSESWSGAAHEEENQTRRLTSVSIPRLALPFGLRVEPVGVATVTALPPGPPLIPFQTILLLRSSSSSVPYPPTLIAPQSLPASATSSISPSFELLELCARCDERMSSSSICSGKRFGGGREPDPGRERVPAVDACPDGGACACVREGSRAEEPGQLDRMPGTVTAPARESRNRVASLAISA